MNKALLSCGIIAVSIFIITTIIGGIITPNYNQLSNAISELTQTGSKYGLLLAIPYCFWDIFLILFFIGITRSMKNKIITAASILMIFDAFVSIFSYTFLTMDPIGSKPTIPGTIHLIYGTTLGMLIPLGSMILFIIGLWNKFRNLSIYSMITLILTLIFGVITALLTPLALANKFYYYGLVQRIMMFIGYQWIIVLSIILINNENKNKAAG
jgi:hypothetical protein